MSVLAGEGGTLNQSSPMNATGLVDTSAHIVFMVFHSVLFLVRTPQLLFCSALLCSAIP